MTDTRDRALAIIEAERSGLDGILFDRRDVLEILERIERAINEL